MSGPRRSSTVRRRRLSAEIRRLREEVGMTSVEATKRLEWSSGRLTKMERGEWVLPNPRDIRDLCDLYGVTDERQRDYLITLAKEGREKGWWNAHKKDLPETFSHYIGLEAGAAELYVAHPVIIPGLLQTADYARATILGGPAEVDEAEAERRVEVRHERQQNLIFREDDPLRLYVVIDEAALRRQVGGPAVMRAQLEHLADLSKLAKVSIQVVPFGAGAHPAVAGSFSILKFPEPQDPDIVYVETVAGDLFVEEKEEVGDFDIAFRRLQMAALSPVDSIDMIAATAAMI
jgi:transcriptional regulator with XRE-family HTH domain